MNYVRTGMLLAAMTALFMGIGFMIGGQSGMLIALVIAGGMNIFSYWNSDRMVLSMHHAQEVDEQQRRSYMAWFGPWQRARNYQCPRFM